MKKISAILLVVLLCGCASELPEGYTMMCSEDGWYSIKDDKGRHLGSIGVSRFRWVTIQKAWDWNKYNEPPPRDQHGPWGVCE